MCNALVRDGCFFLSVQQGSRRLCCDQAEALSEMCGAFKQNMHIIKNPDGGIVYRNLADHLVAYLIVGTLR